MNQGDTLVQGDTGGYAPTVEGLLEYAGNRFSDGDHLAEQVVAKVAEGIDPIELRNYFAKNESFLMAYFADCIWRMQAERTSDW